MTIYKITNRIDGKIYIGQTVRRLERRWKEHCDKSSHCLALHNAIAKYGAENFTVEQIDVACSVDELNAKEKYWIAFYNSVAPNGYNLTSGGESGKEMSPESREKLSESKRGKKTWISGKHHTEETRRKISEIQTGTRMGKDNHKSVTIKCVETGEIFDSIGEAERKYGVTRTHVCACCRGKRKTAGGYHWEYANCLQER